MYFRVSGTDEANDVPKLWLSACAEHEGRPLISYREFDRFLGAWRANDPNGNWGRVVELGQGSLIRYTDDDDGSQDRAAVSTCVSSTPLFDVGGLVAVEPVHPR
ncbi:MAG: hypothetical protein WAV90_02480 [Gordonia amarae]